MRNVQFEKSYFTFICTFKSQTLLTIVFRYIKIANRTTVAEGTDAKFLKAVFFAFTFLQAIQPVRILISIDNTRGEVVGTSFKLHC